MPDTTTDATPDTTPDTTSSSSPPSVRAPRVIAVKPEDRLVSKPGTGGAIVWNWVPFRRRFLMLAELHSIDTVIVDGIHPQPDGSLSDDDKLVDKEARSAIMGSIANPELVDDCRTAHAMWTKLTSRFEARTLAQEMFLMDKLQSMRFDIGSSLEDHISALFLVRSELRSMGVGSELTDTFMAKRLIQSLPYDEFATTIDALDDTKLDLDEIRLKLLNKYSRLMQNMPAKKIVPPGAFVAMRDSSRGGAFPPCEWCSRTNHSAKNCWTKYGRDNVEARRGGVTARTGRVSQPTSLIAREVPSSSGQASSLCEEPLQGFAFTIRAPAPHLPPSALSIAIKLTEHQRVGGWIVDSGASHHFCFTRDRFRNYTPLKSPMMIQLGGVGEMVGLGYGDIIISYPLNGQVAQMTLQRALYVPQARFNLLSISHLDDEGKLITFHGGVCRVYEPTGPPSLEPDFARAELTLQVARTQSSNLYHLNDLLTATPMSHQAPSALTAITGQSNVPVVSADLLHARLGHVNHVDMKRLTTMADGLAYSGEVSATCETCIMAKHHRTPTPKVRTTETTELLELVHSDIAGPFPVNGLHGERYFAIFMDDHSCMVWLRLLKSKDEVLPAFVEWKTFVENQTGKKIKAFRSDNAMEYQSAAFSKVLSDSGIQRQSSATYTQAQNGKSERCVRTITEFGRSILFFSNLPLPFWSVAVEHACYLRNRLPTRALASSTPYEVWFGRRPDLRHVRVFGSVAYAHVPDERRKKLDPKARKGIYLGVAAGIKGHRLYDPVKRTLFVSAHVKFDERSSVLDPSDMDTIVAIFRVDDAPPAGEPSSQPSSASDSDDFSIDSESAVENEPVEVPVASDPFDHIGDNDASMPRRSSRRRQVPDRYIHSDRIGDQLGLSSVSQHSAARPVDSLTSSGDQVLDSIPEPRCDPAADPAAELQPPAASLVADALPSPWTPVQPVTNVMFNGCAVGDQLTPTVGYVGLPAVPGVCSSVLDSPSTDASAAHLDTEDYEKLFSSGFALVATEVALHNEPASYRQAVNGPDADAWLSAMDDEYKSLMDAGTFELVKLPQGANLVTCRWVFRLKQNADGSVSRFKARLVARGFTQRQGVDYDLTFAPVVKLQSVRALLALAASQDWEIHQMDVVTAYLNGDLEHTIYMAQPEGFIPDGQQGLVCLLKKSLYGLKQAGRSWNIKIHQVLVKLGFTRMEADHCVYRFVNNATIIWLCLYVDDLLLFSNHLPALSAFKRRLAAEFRMKDLGEAKFVLGITIERNRVARTIAISQAAYVRSVLARFRQENAKPVFTPLDAGQHLTKSDCPVDGSPEQQFMRSVPYLQAVGAIMFLMLATRPDLAFAITKLAQFSHNPGKTHWQALQRLLRYLRGTESMSITYGGNTEPLPTSVSIAAFCDADWASDRDDRRSTTGYVVIINGGGVSWQAKKQPTVSASSVEAEYVSMSQAAKEVQWWIYLLDGLNESVPTPFPIFSDSQGAIALVDQPSCHSKCKHIDVRHHHIRDLHDRRVVDFFYLRTEEMPADLLTKALTRNVHARLLSKFGLAVDSSGPVGLSQSSDQQS